MEKRLREGSLGMITAEQERELYRCVGAHVCMCIHVHTHTCSMWMHVCSHVHTCISVHTCVLCVHVFHAHTYLHIHGCVCVHTYVCVFNSSKLRCSDNLCVCTPPWETRELEDTERISQSLKCGESSDPWGQGQGWQTGYRGPEGGCGFGVPTVCHAHGCCPGIAAETTGNPRAVAVLPGTLICQSQ